jgi:parallel beta-helix repeat protein
MKTAFPVLFIICMLASTLVLIYPAKAISKTIVVPDDYPTIQTAVASASPGDTVFVRSGSYSGGIVVDKPILLKGEDAKTTIIAGGTTAGDLGITSVALKETTEPSFAKLAFKELTESPKIQPANFIPPLTFAVVVNSNDVTISGFTIMGGDRAIYSSKGDRLEVLQNILGTCILGGSNNTVSNNSRIGLTIGGYHNLIANNSGGFVLSSNSTIMGNSLGGFALQNAYSNIIVNNTLSSSNMGLWIGSSISSGPPTCSNNLFAGNKIENCGLWGILMGAGSYNVFFGNIVENTGVGIGHDGYGLALGGNGLTAEKNLFLHNSFVNNSKNFGVNWSVTGANSFDDGKEGNYWDDYLTRYPNATEVNNSGTGSVSYVLTEINADNHPLLVQPIISGKVPALPEPWASLLHTHSTLPNSSPSLPSLSPSPSPSASPSTNLSPTPTSSPSESPTPSTSPSPSEQHAETAKPTQNQALPQWVIVGAVFLAVVAIVVALVTMVVVRKRRRWPR